MGVGRRRSAPGQVLGPDETDKESPPWFLLVLSWVAAAWLTTGRFLCSVLVCLLPQLLVPSLALTYSHSVCLPCPRAYVSKSLSSHPCLSSHISLCHGTEGRKGGGDEGEGGGGKPLPSQA